MWASILTAVILTSGVLTIPILPEGNSTLTVLAPRITEFKINLHHMLEGSRIRNKRQAEFYEEPSEQKFRFGSSTPEDLPYLSDYNLTFWIPVHHQSYNQVLIGTEQGYLILFQLSDVSDKSAITIAVSEREDVVAKAKAFSHYNEQWFVVLQSSGLKTWIRLFQRLGRGLETRQTITLDGESDFDLVTVKGVHYLAVTTYRSFVSQGITYQATVALYRWTQTQFDVIASRVSYGARSIACWVLDGSLYFAVGQETNDDGNYAVGSPIYLYNAKEENSLVLHEMLATFGPKKVVHFYVAGSRYVIFIGQKDAEIYWWSSDQFLLWQIIGGTSGASDISVLLLPNNEVAIAIALREEIWFLTLDDSGYYVISFTMRLANSILASMQFMFSGKAYYALFLFAASLQHRPQPIWKLTLEPYYLPTAQSLDGLQQCLKNIAEVINERQNELDVLNIDLDRVWLKSKAQNVSTNIIITGQVTSPVVTEISQILIVTDRTKFLESSTSYIHDALLNLNNIIGNIQNELEDVVYNSVWQYIGGVKYFSQGIAIPSLNMQSTNMDISINGISISSLAQSALREVGDQTFPSSRMVGHISTGNAIVQAINGMTPDDLLLLYGDQIITGRLRFSDIGGSSISAGAVNSIPTDYLVTTESDQKIDDLKTFSRLVSDVTDVRGQTNGEYLSEIRDKIVVIDNSDSMTGLLNLVADVHIRGDISTKGLISGDIDIASMATRSVMKSTQQDLTGLKFFMANVHINGNLQVAGLINNFDISRLMTLSNDQIVYADLVFNGSMAINNDLILDNLNGIHLSNDAVLKYAPYQFISGMKYFENSIGTDFIDMTEYVTLDYVDPSLLVQSIVKHEEGVVKNDSTVFHNVFVKGKIIALGGVNGHDVSDLPRIVWLKSHPQAINVTTQTNRLIVKHDLQVKLANNLNLDSDIVHVFQDETIMSIKVFQHRTTVSKHIHPARGRINGIEIASFKEIEEDGQKANIYGTKVLGNLEIYGDLNINGLNNLDDFSGFLLTTTPQIVFGDMDFTSELSSVIGDLKSNLILFSTFNDLHINDYVNNAVTVYPTSKPIVNKFFSELKAVNLLLLDGSKINDVSLTEMEQNVVILNLPQTITAPKVFYSEQRFLMPITVTDMNGIEISDFVNRMVFVDETNQIIQKNFLGPVLTSDAFLNGLINGLNIQEMANNAFYKSQANDVSFFIFGNDIDVGHLATETLDGIEWNDLIFLGADEVLGSGFFLADVVLANNLFITGHLNGCDLSQIRLNAVYSSKPKQIINGEIKVITIKVIGNVKVKNALNTVKDDDLKLFISISEDEDIYSEVRIESGVSVRNLHLLQVTNKANLAFILADAVRRSVPQVISGSKEFHSELSITILNGGDLFIHGMLNDINLEQLDRTAVWRDGGYQVVQGDKILSSVIAETTIIEGYLNGLQIPKDVVMTDTSEHFTSPVIFMSDLFLDSSLLIHGKIDGGDLNNFLNQRMTLTGEQNGTSSLSFLQDVVTGNLYVDGTINDLILDLVLNLKQSFPVQGYKAFLDLKIAGSLFASSVNGFNMLLLEREILRYNREEFIGGVQVFKPVLQAQDLLAYWINGISLQTLSSVFSSVFYSLKTTLNYFEDLSSNIQMQLGNQLTAAGNQISMLAYFILVQEINLGPTTRILHAYNSKTKASEFSHSLVMWTSRKHCAYRERCCKMDFTYWLKVKKSGYVMVDGDADDGRYYPISPALSTSERELMIWTNATQVQPKWCGDKSYETMFLTLGEENSNILNIIRNSPLISDVKSFRQGYLYTVIAFHHDVKGDYRNTVIYAYNELKREWTEHQRLPSSAVLSMDLTSYNQYDKNEILLALGTGMEEHPLSHSSIYKWNNFESEFQILQNIPSQYVTSTLWIHMGSTLMLAMARVKQWPNKMENCFDLISGGEVNIFIYDKDLKWIQSIPVEGVVSMVTFSLEGNTFLIVASAQLDMVLVYKWKGYAGFVLIQTVFAAEVQHLNIYKIDDDIYMTIATMSGSSKILKVTLQGKHSVISKSNEISLEQRDEVPQDQKIKSGC